MSRGTGSQSARRAKQPRRPAEPTALLVPPSVRLRISHAGFWKLCASNRDLRLERTAKGELIVMPPAGSDSGAKNIGLTAYLFFWAKADGTGVAFDSSAGFTLPNGAVRSPDASWIARDRWDVLTPEQKRKFAPICPDFVAELTSPSDTRSVAHEKLVEYIAQGARLGWLLDTQTEEVEIHRPGRQVETLKRPATLSGEDVLLGFVLNLKGILFD